MSIENSKIKIVYVLPSLVSSGGIERQFLAQMKVIDSGQFAIDLITLFSYPDRPTLYADLPAHVTVHRLALRPGIDIKGWWEVFCLLRRLRPEIVVSSMIAANTITQFFKPWLGYQSIAREHNTYTDKHWYHHWREYIGSFFSTKIVAVSKTVANYAAAQAKLKPEKFQVIYNGIDYAAIQNFLQSDSSACVEALRQEFSLRPETKILLNVARLKRQKNQRLLIDGFDLYVQGHPADDVVLFIVGIGSEEEALRVYIKEKGLQQKIILTGYRNDVFTFYAAARAFLLTSDIEGFPNVAIEALAFGVPVASTVVSGIDEIIIDQKQGFLLERNPKSVCDTIDKFLNGEQQDWLAMSKAAKATASTFAIEYVVKEYENLFRSLIKNR